MHKLLIGITATAVLLASPAVATDGSFYKIDGLFSNTPTELISGLAYGAVDKLIQYDAEDDCFREMWIFGQKFVSFSRLNRVRSNLDNYLSFPLQVILAGKQAVQSVTTCI